VPPPAAATCVSGRPTRRNRACLPVDVILFRELSVVGSLGMQAAREPEMLRMVESGRLNPGAMVGDKVPLGYSSVKLIGTGPSSGLSSPASERPYNIPTPAFVYKRG